MAIHAPEGMIGHFVWRQSKSGDTPFGMPRRGRESNARMLLLLILANLAKKNFVSLRTAFELHARHWIMQRARRQPLIMVSVSQNGTTGRGKVLRAHTQRKSSTELSQVIRASRDQTMPRLAAQAFAGWQPQSG